MQRNHIDAQKAWAHVMEAISMEKHYHTISYLMHTAAEASSRCFHGRTVDEQNEHERKTGQRLVSWFPEDERGGMYLSMVCDDGHMLPAHHHTEMVNQYCHMCPFCRKKLFKSPGHSPHIKVYHASQLDAISLRLPVRVPPMFQRIDDLIYFCEVQTTALADITNSKYKYERDRLMELLEPFTFELHYKAKYNEANGIREVFNWQEAYYIAHHPCLRTLQYVMAVLKDVVATPLRDHDYSNVISKLSSFLHSDSLRTYRKEIANGDILLPEIKEYADSPRRALVGPHEPRLKRDIHRYGPTPTSAPLNYWY